MIIFPDLRVSEEEREMHQRIGRQLISRLETLFRDRYRCSPDIRCKGSTDKGTAIPERFFGIDFDASVLADEGLLQKIAYRSDVFEGCQLFSMSFLRNFLDFFEEVYFAGHRISGKIDGKDFDFSITDEKKDRWKWDYNQSKYLRLSPAQVEEIKRMKFFLKTFNVAGSEVYGVVGPAVELLGYQDLKFEDLIKRLAAFERIEEDFSNAFSTVPFPKEFMSLFVQSPDSVHEGLIKSFRYTSPNTWNRLVAAAKMGGLDVDEFVANQKLNHRVEFNSSSNRLVAYVLGTALKEKEYFRVDPLLVDGGVRVYANASMEEARGLENARSLLDCLVSAGEFKVEEVPEEIRRDIKDKSRGDTGKFIFFIGTPKFPLQRNRTYVPFDFLVRSDYKKLVRVMEEGQNDS